MTEDGICYDGQCERPHPHKEYPKCVCTHPIYAHEKLGDFTVRGRCRTREYYYDSGINEFVDEECGCPQFSKP